jgi:hypothetical protein
VNCSSRGIAGRVLQWPRLLEAKVKEEEMAGRKKELVHNLK